MTGGQVFTPRSSRDLAGIYDRILEDLAAQFVVGYVSDNPVRDGRFRKIKVTVKVQNCVLPLPSLAVSVTVFASLWPLSAVEETGLWVTVGLAAQLSLTETGE